MMSRCEGRTLPRVRELKLHLVDASDLYLRRTLPRVRELKQWREALVWAILKRRTLPRVRELKRLYRGGSHGVLESHPSQGA